MAKNNPIKNWLDNSTFATGCVVLTAILGFIISSVNGVYTIYTNLKKETQKPLIEVISITTIPQTTRVNFNNYLGVNLDKSWKFDSIDVKPNMQVDVPTIPIILKVSNPKDIPITLMDFYLNLSFEGKQRLASKRYIVARKQQKVPYNFNESIYLLPKEAKNILVDFLFFIDNKNVDALGKGTIKNYFISYKDQDNNVYSTNLERGPGHFMSKF